MSVKVHAGLDEVELFFWWERAPRNELAKARDPLAARALLARLAAHGYVGALRRLAADQPSAARLDDPALLDKLASWITAGRLRIASSRTAPLLAWDGEREEPPAPELAWDSPPPPLPEEEPSVPVEEALPPTHADGAMLARMLKEAAREGTPLCEECEERLGSRRAESSAPSSATSDHG